MRIDPQAALLQAMLGTATPPKRPEPMRFGGDAFAPAPAAPPTLAAPVQSVQMLVALAAATGDADPRQRAVKEAQDGLDALDRLQQAMALGLAPSERLRALRAWTRKRKPGDDPALDSLVDEVELRILVELAKQERGRG